MDNPGHVPLMPNEHYENICDLPVHLGARGFESAKAVALAVRAAYGCDGTSTRQHNEAAGKQGVCRCTCSPITPVAGFSTIHKELRPEEERAVCARDLRAQLEDWSAFFLLAP